MSNVEKALNDYNEAWRAGDEETRLACLNKCWNDDSVYTDPNTQAVGIDNLNTYMAKLQENVPGAHFEFTSKPVEQNNELTITWNMLNGKNDVIGTGTSFGAVTEDGKLARMTGFFGTPKVTPA